MPEPPFRRRGLVRAADAIGAVVAAPLVLISRLLSLAMGKDEAFRALAESVALLPGPLGIVVRRAVYSRVLGHVGSDVSIGFGTVIVQRAAELGDNVYIGRFCLLADVRIGDGTLLADHVRVISGKHGIEPGVPVRTQASEYRTIHIGADCWLANGALVLADVGAGSVVGAGAVVTKPVAENLVVAGNPARTLRRRDA